MGVFSPQEAFRWPRQRQRIGQEHVDGQAEQVGRLPAIIRVRKGGGRCRPTQDCRFASIASVARRRGGPIGSWGAFARRRSPMEWDTTLSSRSPISVHWQIVGPAKLSYLAPLVSDLSPAQGPDPPGELQSNIYRNMGHAGPQLPGAITFHKLSSIRIMIFRRVFMAEEHSIVLPGGVRQRPHCFEISRELVSGHVPLYGGIDPISSLAFYPNECVLAFDEAVGVRCAF